LLRGSGFFAFASSFGGFSLGSLLLRSSLLGLGLLGAFGVVIGEQHFLRNGLVRYVDFGEQMVDHLLFEDWSAQVGRSARGLAEELEDLLFLARELAELVVKRTLQFVFAHVDAGLFADF